MSSSRGTRALVFPRFFTAAAAPGREIARCILLIGVLVQGGCVSHSVNPANLRAEGASAKRPACHAEHTLSALSREPQSEVPPFHKVIAVATSPIKKAGVSGWTDTGCSASGTGVLVRDMTHSTEGFWTIDVRLVRFAIDGHEAPEHRFLRLEIATGTKAHDVTSSTEIPTGTRVGFGGPVLIDHDGPFLELHPDRDFRIEPGSAAAGKELDVSEMRPRRSATHARRADARAGTERILNGTRPCPHAPCSSISTGP